MRPALLLPLLLLPACTSPGGSDQPDLPVEAGVITAYPFAPTALRIHPLTHVEPGWEQAGSPPQRSQLILHVELLDRYGDSVKGLGALKVELYRAGNTPNTETQDLAWEVPGMDTPESNTRRFDIATRTYRIPLVAPTWLHETVSNGGWLRLKVSMRTPGDNGERTLEDEYTVQQ